jgi:transitional endoplasmic reticulum ATPase
VILEYAGTIMPAGDVATMPADARTDLVTLARWPSDPTIVASGNAIFLCVQSINELHPLLRSASTGYHAVEIPLPDAATRQQFIWWYMAEMAALDRPLVMDMTPPQLANITAGLSLVQLESVFLKAEIAGAVSWQLVRDTKRAIIGQEYAGLLEMLEPTAGFEIVGGMDQLKQWAIEEIITPVAEGRPADMAQGVVLVGPPGTGKTFFVKALAKEIGFNAVALSMESILGMYVGQSEANLARALSVVRSLAPVLLFVDELDQSDVAARGNSSGNPVAKNLFSQLLRFLGEPSNRGRVVFFAASNRPDLLDAALLRSGRVDAVIPVLLPEAPERAAIVTAQAATQGAQITDAARDLMASKSEAYTSADLAALVTKARKIVRRRAGSIIDETDARDALKALRPGSAKTAEYYTMLAVDACNDLDLMPARYAGMLDDRAALAARIEEATPPTPRARRSL